MRPYIVGNWKMHGVTAQLEQIKSIADTVKATSARADVLICVPPTLVIRAAQVARGCIAIGGEDCSAESAGAYTGDVDAAMLRDAGATVVILGHSERRRIHHETDALVAAKAASAWEAGLATIICIGESAEQRSAGQAMAVCESQLAASLPNIAEGAVTSIAYEPLWAISSRHTPIAGDITAMHRHIRLCLTARFADAGRAVRILYGGLVTPSNARGLLGLAEVGGALIGGASLTAVDFDAVLGVARTLARPPQSIAAE